MIRFRPPFSFSLFWPIAFSIAGYLLFRDRFPLTPYFDFVPQLDIRSFSSSLSAGFEYALLLIVLFALYWRVTQLVWIEKRPFSPHLLFGLTLVYGLILINTYPINATDIYRYVIRGRVKSVHQQNQFEMPPDAFPEDPFAKYAGEWSEETTPYGPVWEIVATAVTSISGDNFYLGLLLFKGVGLLSLMGVGYVLWHIHAKQPPERRKAYTLLWCWNPAILLTFVVNAHNDALMIFWLMVGVWFMRRNRLTLGFLFLVIAMLTKPIALLVLPFYFVANFRKLPDWSTRVRFTAVTLLSSLLLTWLAFLPFGSPVDLIFRLVRESSTSAGFSIVALLVLVNQTLQTAILPIRFLQLALVVYILFLLREFWRVVNGRSAPNAIQNSFTGYLLQAANFRLWYTTWLLPWSLIEQPITKKPSYRLKVVLWLLLTAQLSPLIFGHLRVYELDGDQLKAHLIAIPFTFGLPFLLAKIQRVNSAQFRITKDENRTRIFTD